MLGQRAGGQRIQRRGRHRNAAHRGDHPAQHRVGRHALAQRRVGHKEQHGAAVEPEHDQGIRRRGGGRAAEPRCGNRRHGEQHMQRGEAVEQQVPGAGCPGERAQQRVVPDKGQAFADLAHGMGLRRRRLRFAYADAGRFQIETMFAPTLHRIASGAPSRREADSVSAGVACTSSTAQIGSASIVTCAPEIGQDAAEPEAPEVGVGQHRIAAKPGCENGLEKGRNGWQ
jgi:hypothetical protein